MANADNHHIGAACTRSTFADGSPAMASVSRRADHVTRAASSSTSTAPTHEGRRQGRRRVQGVEPWRHLAGDGAERQPLEGPRLPTHPPAARLTHPDDEFRYVLVTSDLPEPGTDIRNQLDAAEPGLAN